MEVRSKGTEKKKKEFPCHFDFYISEIYLIKDYPHVQVKKPQSSICAESHCYPRKQKMVVLIHALFWRTLNLMPKGIWGQEHLFHYTDSHLLFTTIKCKPYSSTTVKMFMALKRDTGNLK